ncbi:MAG: hypothetical protein ACTHN5_23515 [Phycisphaerae bacterium]
MRMRGFWWMGVVVLLGGHVRGAELTGTIKSGQRVVRVVGVDRGKVDVLKVSQEDPKGAFVYEGRFDAGTGRFTVPGVVGGQRYDLIVWTEDEKGVRTRWEGADMDYHRDIRPSTALTDADRKWLEDFVTQMPAFYDKARVVHMAADHGHATLLVELMRTRDFHSDKGGEVIYRVELWYFENLFGGWAKDKNTERVLVRWRGKGMPGGWQFLPGLGGVKVGEDRVVELAGRAEEKNGVAW